MKKVIKIAAVALMAICSTTLYAQKFGRIDYQALVQAMPEITDVQTKMTELTKEREEQLEILQVELNNKVNDLQKAPTTMSESVKQLKQREIQELQGRIQEYYEMAQQELGAAQTELYAPIEAKANEAIQKVCKADGIIIVFHAGSVAYMDEEQVIDILPKVKAELGIQ